MSQSVLEASVRETRRTPVEIGVASSTADRRAAQELRYRVARSKGFLPENATERDEDAYDADALIFLARVSEGPQQGRLVGTVRVIGELDGRFSLERAGFSVPEWLPRDRTREISRWVVLPGANPMASIALAMAAENACRAIGVTHCISNSTGQAIRSIQRGGWDLIPLGEPLAVLSAFGCDELFHPFAIPVPTTPRSYPAGVTFVGDHA